MGGVHKVITTTVATDAKTTSAVPIKDWPHVAIVVQTFSTGLITATANIYCQVCNTSTGTFRRVVDQGVYSGGSGLLDWEVPSSAGNRHIICHPAAGYNYAKAEFSNTATTTMDVYFHVHN